APDVATICASPLDSAVTRPVALTVATASSSDDQVSDAPAIVCPPPSRTTAPSWVVAPMASSVAPSGEISTDAATCCTVTLTVSAAPPATATIEALPLACAVTTPLAFTLATAAFSDDHATAAPAIVWALASVTAADSAAVAPTAFSETLAGETTTDAGTCATVISAVSLSAALVPITRVAPGASATTRPWVSTEAMALFSTLHVTGWPVTVSPCGVVRVSENCTVSRSAVKLADAGAIDAFDGGGSVTTARTESRSTPAIARMLAVPAPVASTRPAATVATCSSDDTHVMGWAGAALPNASVNDVDSCAVSPTCRSS